MYNNFGGGKGFFSESKLKKSEERRKSKVAVND